jgi:hypothetical protein
MAVEALIQTRLEVNETVSGAGVSGTITVLQDALNFNSTLTSATSPPATKCTFLSKALSGGSATIDLTSLPDLNGNAGAVTFNGLKVQAIILSVPSTNTGPITISKGASNGYGLVSAGTTFSFPLAPGFRGVLFFDDEPPDVSGSAKTFDLSGTGTETLSIGMVAG